MVDHEVLTDWTVGWSRLRPWAGRLALAASVVSVSLVAGTGIWLSVRYDGGLEPGNEHYSGPPAPSWAHQVHVRSAAVAIATITVVLGILAIERLHERHPGALRSAACAGIVVALLVIGERSGAGLQWIDYSMHGAEVSRNDEDGVRRAFSPDRQPLHGLPYNGIWSVVADDRIDSVTTLRHRVPVSSDAVSVSEYRGHVVGHLVAMPLAGATAMALFLRSRRRPTWPRGRLWLECGGEVGGTSPQSAGVSAPNLLVDRPSGHLPPP